MKVTITIEVDAGDADAVMAPLHASGRAVPEAPPPPSTAAGPVSAPTEEPQGVTGCDTPGPTCTGPGDPAIAAVENIGAVGTGVEKKPGRLRPTGGDIDFSKAETTTPDGGDVVEAVELLESLGVKNLRRLVDTYRPARLIEVCQAVIEKGDSIGNPGGLVHCTLSRGWKV